MYISNNSQSSRNLFQTNHTSQTPFSFSAYPTQHLNPTYPSKRLSSQIQSFPLTYHLHTPTKTSNENNLNSGRASEFSKIEEINNKISRTTEEILNNKQKYKISQSDHYKVFKQPEQKKRKYLRQFVRIQPETGSLTKYNCGSETVAVKGELKDQQSEEKRSRKDSVKINFLYENSPQKKEVIKSTIIQNVFKPEKDSLKSPRSSLQLSPSSNYQSTELILTQNNNLTRKSSLKKDVKFIYYTTSNQQNELNRNKTSSISAYELSKYSPKSKEEKQQQKQNMFKKTTLQYLSENYFAESNPYAENNQSQSQDVFYDMRESLKKQKITQKQESIQKVILYADQVKKQQHTPSIAKIITQLKDYQSRLIAIVLITLAIMIFIMQLFS